MRIRVALDPPMLTVGPMRGRALALAAVVAVYLAILLWVFTQGRLPWQDGPADLRSLIQDFRVVLVAIGGATFVLYQLGEAAFTRSWVLTPTQIEVHSPVFGRRLFPRAEVQHELTQTFVGGRRLFRVQVELPSKGGGRATKCTLAGGPDEYESMLIALDAAVRAPSSDRFRELVPLADAVAADQSGLERTMVVLMAISGVALGWFALR